MSARPGSPRSFSLPAAVVRYGSLVYRERPAHDDDLFSRRHPKMSRLNRAKIFAPFAALVGFDERVRGKEVQYVPRRELDADEEWELNHRLCELRDLTANSRLARANAVRVSVEYFAPCTDAENDAYRTMGLYRTVTGIVLRVDPLNQALTIRTEGQVEVIAFADIYRIA